MLLRLCVSLLLLSSLLEATTITGTLPSPVSAGGANGTLYLTPPPGASVSHTCTGSLSGAPFVITLTNGVPSGTTTVVGNDCLIPGNTNYSVQYVDQSQAVYTANWQLRGSTFSLNTQILGPSQLVSVVRATTVNSIPAATGNPYLPGQSGDLFAQTDAASQGWLWVNINGSWQRLNGAETVSVKADFGAKGDGVTDDTLAIQNALNSGATTIFFPDGTYELHPQGGTPNTMLTYGANVHLLFQSPNAVLQVANNVGPYDVVLYNGSNCSNDVVEGGTIDSNIANNPIANSAESAAHPRREFVCLGGNHIQIKYMTVKNSSSRNSFWFVPNSGTMDDLQLIGNSCLNMGDDPNHVFHDSSCFYWIAATNVRVSKNIGEAALINSPGANTFIEGHGSNVVVEGNQVTNYNQGLIIAGINTSTITNNVAQGNTFTGCIYCIVLASAQYLSHTSGFGIDGAIVSNNTLLVKQTQYTTSASGVVDATNPQGIAFQNYSNNLPMRNIEIAHNKITFDVETTFRNINSTSLAIGGVLLPTGANLVDTSVHDNTIINAPASAIRFSNWNVQDLNIFHNIIRDSNSLVPLDLVGNGFINVTMSGGVATVNLSVLAPSYITQATILGSATTALNNSYQITSVNTGCTTAGCFTFSSALGGGPYSDPTHIYVSSVLLAYRDAIIANNNTAVGIEINQNSIIDDQTVSTLRNGVQVATASAATGPVNIFGNTYTIVDSTHTSWSSPWTCDTNSGCLAGQVLPPGLTYSPVVYARAGSTLVTYSGSTPTNWYTALTGSAWNTAPFAQYTAFAYTSALSPVAVNPRIVYQYCDATTNNVAFNLPSIAASGTGFTLVFKKLDVSAHTCTISRAGSDTIDGSASITLSTQYKYIVISPYGGSYNVWNVIGSN